MIPKKPDIELPAAWFGPRADHGPNHNKLLAFLTEARAFGVIVYGFAIDPEAFDLLRGELHPESERNGALLFLSCNGFCRVTKADSW